MLSSRASALIGVLKKISFVLYLKKHELRFSFYISFLALVFSALSLSLLHTTVLEVYRVCYVMCSLISYAFFFCIDLIRSSLHFGKKSHVTWAQQTFAAAVLKAYLCFGVLYFHCVLILICNTSFAMQS